MKINALKRSILGEIQQAMAVMNAQLVICELKDTFVDYIILNQHKKYSNPKELR